MILVVGGTGFIGRHFLQSLAGSQRLAVTASRNPDRAFLAEHAASIEAVTMSELYRQPDRLAEFSAVVWLAGGNGPAQNVGEPWREMSQTVEPVVEFAHRALRVRPDMHFVYLSSGGTVYGSVCGRLATEDMPLRPISSYGFGKVVAEAALFSIAASHGLKLTVLRPSNPIGAWQVGKQQGVVRSILNAMKTDAPFTIFGDGENLRDYFDARDLAAAIVRTLDMPDQAAGRIFNVGSGQARSVNDIVSLVETVTGQTLNVVRLPGRSVDVKEIVLDTSRIRAELGWAAKIPLKQSVEDMVAGSSVIAD
ncbi:NAD-dependent epimerase/dehydratase family protein [Jiella mangrovi]|uniref:UDP-glucose 4-epimerase n=1 Tax=Jiella mangrovi TaxID=2821407 RepID=A0ABS4BJ46_9HYPH|nr:NAD-dependent epimerase/dehydratase family protein [Jiella mangrovi]MBP0616039.1 NAD-dependent epimerase/dehydratase family protein [Jiella mangrovi]